MEKIILHLDMDAFFASVEQAIDPALRGKPLIVGSRGSRYRTVVAACSYEAKAYGISSGMPTAQAFRLCPQALFVAADSPKYLDTSDRISRFLQELSPRLERPSIDEFYMDLSFGDFDKACALARQIKERIRRCFSITGSVGIAAAKIVAKMAAKARKPDGLLAVRPEETEGFLAPLPVQRVPGIGPRLTERLNQLAIFTCADLAAVDRQWLAQQFGSVGSWMAEVSRGHDYDEVRFWDDPEPLPKSISHSYTLERTLYRRPQIEGWLRLLAEMVCYRLRKEALAARIVHVWLKGEDAVMSRQKDFKTASADPAQVFKRCRHILEDFGKNIPGVRALGLSVSGLEEDQGWYLLAGDRKRAALLAAQDRINDRFGEWSIYPASVNKIS